MAPSFAESVTLNITVVEPVDTCGFNLRLTKLKIFKTVHPHGGQAASFYLHGLCPHRWILLKILKAALLRFTFPVTGKHNDGGVP